MGYADRHHHRRGQPRDTAIAAWQRSARCRPGRQFDVQCAGRGDSPGNSNVCCQWQQLAGPRRPDHGRRSGHGHDPCQRHEHSGCHRDSDRNCGSVDHKQLASGRHSRNRLYRDRRGRRRRDSFDVVRNGSAGVALTEFHDRRAFGHADFRRFYDRDLHRHGLDEPHASDRNEATDCRRLPAEWPVDLDCYVAGRHGRNVILHDRLGDGWGDAVYVVRQRLAGRAEH
jgi:hypothetical protein